MKAVRELARTLKGKRAKFNSLTKCPKMAPGGINYHLQHSNWRILKRQGRKALTKLKRYSLSAL